MARSHHDTKLSSSITVAQYLELERVDDRIALGTFIRTRFEERYFKPIEDSQSKHGFTSLAIGCLVIETLESFYQGRIDTRRVSAQMFRDFFNRDTPLKVFASADNWFYENVRCGILHQGEVRGGWRVLRSGPLLDEPSKSINATRFLRNLRKIVSVYAHQVASDEECCRNFKKKMAAVCLNCQ